MVLGGMSREVSVPNSMTTHAGLGSSDCMTVGATDQVTIAVGICVTVVTVIFMNTAGVGYYLGLVTERIMTGSTLG